MHNVGRGRVFDMMDLAHIARDHQNLVGLEFHERGWRNKAVHRHRAPIDSAENIIHLLDPRNALKGNAGDEQSLKINYVSVFIKEKNIMVHYEPSDSKIDRR